MTRTQAIDLITQRLAELPDERINVLAELADAFSRPTFYSTMTDQQRTELDRSIAEADRGEGSEGEAVFTRIAARHGLTRGA